MEIQSCPPGRAISGRLWKQQEKRATSRVSVKTLHPGFAKRMKIAQEHRRMKEIEKELRDEKSEAKKKMIEERKQRLERQKANEKRGEVIQVISNARKLKRLGRKQMRNIVERPLY